MSEAPVTAEKGSQRWFRRFGMKSVGAAGVLAAIVMMSLIFARLGTSAAPIQPAGFAGSSEPFIELPTHAAVPSIRFQDAEGRELGLEDFRGKLVLLNFWATWCGPCVREMPSLERLSAALPGENFVVLPLSQDRGGLPVVETFYKAQGLTGLPRYVEAPGKAGRAFKLRGLPTTILIGPDGLEIGRFEGAARWDAADSLALIRKYLPAGKNLPGNLRADAR